ncbi:Hypothetical protein GbCGDNIH2_8053 [Granulibacter bethesdensis]|uniref:Uncharacterized protein n=1 Tax=Granulibacter bethesdensis (strain ATCC BAA-1260 / CGDNIH1) TaxID=391165 RepID=A0A286M397_GRABC|nr:Hypothetical protein GbCGDNIH2_8053 [Granulibacter bethesdensis]APG31175.1 Hypothetical protein GbCGDNIH4_8053 [Granulibacter bethesdensis CGDNIH4]APH53129.1 Hypothetical protein GbCGDNIH5_8053 [Granulibacter bethesdensis]APH65818.1 Hypothetical protein GbCGDNIH1I4_8053 [Granulibacter bethesdensis]ASV62496.1 Hypothetical protein GbCGDNIH1_8053 [Granulibacter bethesdensis CGDNIH1]
MRCFECAARRSPAARATGIAACMDAAACRVAGDADQIPPPGAVRSLSYRNRRDSPNPNRPTLSRVRGIQSVWGEKRMFLPCSIPFGIRSCRRIRSGEVRRRPAWADPLYAGWKRQN